MLPYLFSEVRKVEGFLFRISANPRASFAAASASSLPSMPMCAGSQAMVIFFFANRESIFRRSLRMRVSELSVWLSACRHEKKSVSIIKDFSEIFWLCQEPYLWLLLLQHRLMHLVLIFVVSLIALLG